MDYGLKLDFENSKRTYDVHLPDSIKGCPPKSVPVMFYLHGGGGNATISRRQTKSDAAADRFGFIAVTPEGTSMGPRLFTWNGGKCCGYAATHNINDVGFFSKLIDTVRANPFVDPTRIYVCGFSNGAMMAYRLACELSEKIAAVGIVSGSLGIMQGPKVPVPMVIIHGREDRNIPIEGGVGPKAIEKCDHEPLLDTFLHFAAMNGTHSPKLSAGANYAKLTCDGTAPVELYLLDHGGHTWPGGVDVTAKFDDGPVVEDFDANAVIWEFCKRFTR